MCIRGLEVGAGDNIERIQIKSQVSLHDLRVSVMRVVCRLERDWGFGWDIGVV